MSLSEYIEGAAYFLVTLGGTGVAAALLRGRLGPALAGAPAVVALGVCWLAGIYAVHLVPGMLGLLEREAVAAAALLLAAASWVLTRGRAAGPDAAPALYPGSPPSGLRSTVFAAVGVGGTVVLLVALLLEDLTVPVMHIDVVSFHLPNVARWIQSGTLWQADDFIPDRAPGYYPQTGDLFSLSAILPWRSDFLVRFVNYPLLGLTFTSSYALARELRAPAATAAIVAAAFVAMPLVSWVGFASLADPAMLATYSGGAYFLLRHSRTQARTDLVLAGLGLGLSLGTRWYAVPAVAALLVVWLAGAKLSGVDWRVLGARLAGLAGLIAVAGGFWLLRNLVEAGNPVFPVKVSPGGITLFDAPPDLYRELQGYTISHYLFQPDIWIDVFWPRFIVAMSWAAIALWAGLAAGLAVGLVALRRARAGRHAPPDHVRVLGLVAAAFIISCAYIVTPYSAVGDEGEPLFAAVNSRYVVPALLLGVPVTAWAISRAGAWRQALELALLLSILDALRRILPLPGPDLSEASIVLAVLVLAAIVALVAVLRSLAASGRRLALAAATTGTLALLLVAGRAQEDAFSDGRYQGISPVGAYVEDNAPADRRIGIVGEGWGNYPLFGPEFRNSVEYIGPVEEHLLTTYKRRADFQAAVERGRYDYVLVQELSSLDPELPRRHESWLRELGWRELFESQQTLANGVPLRLYAAPG